MPERAAFLIFRDCLDHRTEDVWVNLRPVEVADMQEIGPRDLAEARYVHADRRTGRRSRKERRRPIVAGLAARTILSLDVHGAEQLTNHLVGVG